MFVDLMVHIERRYVVNADVTFVVCCAAPRMDNASAESFDGLNGFAEHAETVWSTEPKRGQNSRRLGAGAPGLLSFERLLGRPRPASGLPSMAESALSGNAKFARP